ncbi:DegT/DnrJ/EryC1/StrS family aminotransferase [Bacteroides muris (ex Fokt et al. 2023)]|uniref:DegT/DnrJ/EryC1/StrS family aminotransferase n=1 Tax=Bacteroides muris (ex Fokt et al. 2023) TaxID=2937417 RepID=UPI002152458A
MIASWEKYDIQELLKSSAIMITDYSSVFFDMIYMKKPIIFYQFDEEKYRKYQYGEGYFDYHHNAFGNTCSSSDLVIKELEKMADKYDIPIIEDAAEGFGSKFDGQVLGTFGRYGVLSFNGNKMITTSGGGALICADEESKREIMFYATQARESYPYYQHECIGYNYRMSNICAGIGRGQMIVVDEHIAHHKYLCGLYRELLADVEGITLHENSSGRYDSNYWLNTVLLDEDLHVKGEEDAYRETVKGAVGGAAGVTHESVSAHTSCEPNRNVEAMRLWLDKVGIESRPLWKPMHLQPVYANNPAYVNGVSEGLFKRGLCLPSGPYVTDEDVRYIVDEMKKCI